jgi:hypothetical protein
MSLYTIEEVQQRAATSPVTNVQLEPVPQPNAYGEFDSPLDGALFMASIGIRQHPLFPRDKKPILKEWEDKATADFEQIRRWAQEYPNCNFGSVAKQDFIVFEVDSPEVRKRFQQTGQDFSSKLVIASSPGHGHRWYRYIEGIENISQSKVRFKDFSLRVMNAYAVSPGSIHGGTGKQYKVLVNGLPDIPNAAEVEFWASEKEGLVSKSSDGDHGLDDAPIPSGYRNSRLASILGKLWHTRQFSESELEEKALQINRDRCQLPLDETEVKAIAASISRYPRQDTTVLVNGVPAGERFTPSEQDVDDTALAPRPVFPRWVMEGTSLYEGLAKPAATVSSKYPGMIFMPAVLMMMNYLSNQVRRKNCPHVSNMYLGIISPYGKFFKSSSCELAHEYFKFMGLSERYRPSMKNAEGKIVITGVGSTEGLGINMQRVNARKAILYYDELGKFMAKAKIENSSFVDDLLTIYESGDFTNNVKSAAHSFLHEAGTYCFSWMWCTTDRAFPQHWAKLSGNTSGLNDRMFFLLSPEEPKKAGVYQQPDFGPGAARTKQLIDKAVQQGVYDYEDYQFIQTAVDGLDPRSIGLVENLALYFAVDLGLDEIDSDCIERAKALVEYRNGVLAYLDPIEAETLQGRLQQEIIRELRRNGGKMPYRELCRNLHANRKGTRFWNDSIVGLAQDGQIALGSAAHGRGPEQQPRLVYLLRQDD